MMTTMIDDNNNDSLEKVSRQFAHLMARAKSTDSSSEAENCVALAQRLLWKHDLEEAQLLSLDEIKKRTRKHIKDSVRVGKSTWTMNGKFNSREWKAELLATIAKNFFCRMRPSSYAEYDVIVGEPKNVQMVKDMFAYLEKQIRAVRKTAYKLAEPELPRAYVNGSFWRRTEAPQQFAVLAWKESFAKGAVSAIQKRLELTQKENVEEANVQHAQTAISYGAALVAQIYNDLDESYYELFPEEHPQAIKLAQYKRTIEYNTRMAQLEVERQEREARIAAGLEEPPAPPKPYKEYKRRGRKPSYRSTENYKAYTQGTVAGNNMQLHTAVKGSKVALNA